MFEKDFLRTHFVHCWHGASAVFLSIANLIFQMGLIKFNAIPTVTNFVELSEVIVGSSCVNTFRHYRVLKDQFSAISCLGSWKICFLKETWSGARKMMHSMPSFALKCWLLKVIPVTSNFCSQFELPADFNSYRYLHHVYVLDFNDFYTWSSRFIST